MGRLARVLATCGPVGFAPVAPGTWGSAVGLALAVLVARLGGPVLLASTIGVVVLVGVWSADEAERQLGRPDPGPVVIDEVAGMLITVAGLHLTLVSAVVGFLVFRVLDIVKPWPARQFERLHGGLGIMADDCMAGFYGALLMHLGVRLLPGWLA